MQYSKFEKFDEVLKKVDQIQQQQINIRKQQVEDRIILTKLEKRFAIIESQITSPNNNICKLKKKDSLQYKLAHSISSVVGLKEAITWKSKLLKCVWTIALCVGLTATAYFVYKSCAEYLREPTASKVEMIRKDEYEYPPVLLCPNVWLNADKALSMGLSLEGLKYSMGYVNYYRDKIAPDNIKSGKEQFFNFYDKSNFTSMDDYLMEISHDVPLEPSEEKYDETFYSSAYCPKCNGSFLPKVVSKNGVCYNFQMSPERRVTPLSSVSRLIGLQLEGRSQGLIDSSLWGLYVSAGRNHITLKNPVAPLMVVREFTITGIRFIEQRFYTQSNKETFCSSGAIEGTNYSSTTCITKCISPLYKRSSYNCTPFDSTVGEFKNHPSELCNAFDWATKSKFGEILKSGKVFVVESDEAKQCYKKCPSSCNRVRYEATYLGGFKSSDHSVAWGNMAKQARQVNTTFADIFIENAALYQGGVLTLWEIDTISLFELISNVGGTLGLFVGCTMMTFVQVVLFIVKYIAERNN